MTASAPTLEEAHAAIILLERMITETPRSLEYWTVRNQLQRTSDAADKLDQVRKATVMVLSLFEAYPMLDAIELQARVEQEKDDEGQFDEHSYQEALSVYLVPGFDTDTVRAVKADINNLLAEDESVPDWLEAAMEALKSSGLNIDKFQYCEPYELACALEATCIEDKELTFFATQVKPHLQHGDIDVAALDLFPAVMAELVEELGMDRLVQHPAAARSDRPKG